MIFGMLSSYIKGLRNGPQEKSHSMGEMNAFEIQELRIKYKEIIDN